jgi:oxygen-independent coproporphyrinogen-3 oxidase
MSDRGIRNHAEKISAIPLALYAHIPWCVRKCPYCDFNSFGLGRVDTTELPEARYVDALIADLDASLPRIGGREVLSVFFGGGTPSLFSAEGIERLIGTIRSRGKLVPDAEITLEANPGAIEREKFAAFRDAGVNRLSLGVQSFDDRFLKAIGRIHDAAQARHAACVAARVFPIFNIDLIHGLPGQELEDALDDVEKALAFSPTHLSCYALTLESGTAFESKRPELPDVDLVADMGDAVEEKLASNGFVRYEVSAFARPGRECRHNLNYWTFGDYLGVGAGAHSKLTQKSGAGIEIRREARWGKPDTYISRARTGRAVQKDFPVPSQDRALEFMMNALRLAEGFDTAIFEARTFLPIESVARGLDLAEAGGLIERTETRLRPTAKGLRFLNRLLALF